MKNKDNLNFEQEYSEFAGHKAFYDGIPAEHLRALGASYWKATRNKVGYFRLMENVLSANRGDIAIANDEEFRSSIYANISEFSREIANFYNDDILKRYKPIDELHSKIYVSKSDYLPQELMVTVNQYLEKTKKREGLELPDIKAVSNFYFSHVKQTYENSINALLKLTEEEQSELLQIGIQPNTNIGYDQFTKQSKRTFGTQFTEYCLVHLGRKHPFTVNGILDAVDDAVRKKHYPPFVLFYRTQGGTKTKTRAVYGGGILAKAVGALLIALKNESKKIKYIGKWPWVAWLNWDDMFKTLRFQHEDPEALIVGEDFSGYDQSILAEDLLFVKRYNGKLKNILIWTWHLIKESKVWAGKARVADVIFKSGHPLTSEWGSIIHYLLTYISAKDNNWKIKDAIFLSDDNLVNWQNFDFKEHVNVMERYGFEVSAEKSSFYPRDGFTEFLKNQTGYIMGERVITIGNPVSRYLGLAHVERLGDSRGLYKITGDNGVDQVISKLGSFGSAGLPFVNNVLRAIDGTLLGKKVYSGLQLLQTGDLSIDAERTDFEISFAPTWLKDANLFLGNN